MKNEFGTYIKEARRRREWTLTRASKACGISREYISNLETGKFSNPSAKVLIQLCMVYSFQPAYILNFIANDLDNKK